MLETCISSLYTYLWHAQHCPRQSGNQAEGDMSLPSRSRTQWKRQTDEQPWLSVRNAERNMCARQLVLHSASLNFSFLTCKLGIIIKTYFTRWCEVLPWCEWDKRHFMTKCSSLSEKTNGNGVKWKCRRGWRQKGWEIISKHVKLVARRSHTLLTANLTCLIYTVAFIIPQHALQDLWPFP